ERLDDLHCRPTLHDANCEARTGRGAYDLGIVGIDRSLPEDDYLRAGRRGATHERARVPGIAEPGPNEGKIDPAERLRAAPLHRGDREDRLRRRGIPDARPGVGVEPAPRDTR